MNMIRCWPFDAIAEHSYCERGQRACMRIVDLEVALSRSDFFFLVLILTHSSSVI